MKEKKIMPRNEIVHSEAFCDLDYEKSAWFVNQIVVTYGEQE